MLKLNNLIYIIVISVICFIGLNFINCNFTLPFSLYGNSLSNSGKNLLNVNCSDSDKKAYDALFVLLNTVIALKTKL
jgi:hypothetical protein